MKEYLFIYGLFRDSARTLLGDFTNCGRAWIPGKIFKVNEFYPGYVSGKGQVWGEVYLINPIIFPVLDEFEGDEYSRITIKTSTDIDCWVYMYKFDTSNFKQIKSGDWLLR